MTFDHPALKRAPFYLTCGSAVAILFSIAISQILLALAFAALLLSGGRMRFPPIKIPLALFFLGTVISMALADTPSIGTPQIRKFFVYLILLLVYSTFQRLEEVVAVVLAWAGVAGLSAMRSLFQFLQKYRESQDQAKGFYDYYVGERITGFTSHWMTFGGEEMIVLLMLGAFLLLIPRSRWKIAGSVCAAILMASMLLGFTRGIWLGTFAGGMYLVWLWRKWVVVALPVALALALLVSPGWMRERVTSSFKPHGDTDSNQFRVVVWRTGWAMIQAHPWFGLGPEEVKAELPRYIPADIPRPLPTGWYGHLHSIYLHYAAERGIPTMLALMWMLGKILHDFVRAVRRKPVRAEARVVLHGAIAVLIGILVVGFFELNLGDSEVLTMFLTVTGFGYIARESA